MRKITFYCDRCGKLIDAEVDQLGVRFLNTDGMETDKEYSAELCPDCFNEINDMITWMILNPDVHFNGGKQVGAEKPKRITKKKDLDLGKMAALRNAGWSFRKIADELGCSDVTVSARMEEAQAFLRKQNLKEDLAEALENDIQEV